MVGSVPPFATTYLLLHDLPIGSIVAWFRQIAQIPEFWFLCDGTHGTPDLTDRIPVAAGSSYDVGETGGRTEHSHGGITDGHFHTIQAAPDIGFTSATIGTVSDTKTDTFETARSDHLPTFRATAYIMYQG